MKPENELLKKYIYQNVTEKCDRDKCALCDGELLPIGVFTDLIMTDECFESGLPIKIKMICIDYLSHMSSLKMTKKEMMLLFDMIELISILTEVD